MVPGHFAERHFAERHFAERHFAVKKIFQDVKIFSGHKRRGKKNT
jgi:hypothetical protein